MSHRAIQGVSLVVLVGLAACSSSPPPPPLAPVASGASGGAALMPLPVAAPPPDAPEDTAAVPIGPSDPTWGSRLAPVTLIEFAEFQCPFCARLETTLQQVKEAYGPDKLRIVWKHNPLPFHPNARPASEAAAGVFALGGSDAFWRFHDLAFKDQSALSAAAYDDWAKQAGVDPSALDSGLAAHTWGPKVDADMEVAKRVGATGTPTAFVNGVLVSGAQPFDKWKTVIDAELAKAGTLLANGTPRDRVYLAAAAANFTRPHAAEPTERHEDTTTVFKVPVAHGAVRGPSTALVTIVEFADFQCPYCKKVTPTLDEVRAKYGNKVRLVWRDEPLPFHAHAEPAAELALEARAEGGDAGFWRAHDALFASQPKLEDADLDAVATSLGLRLDKVHKAMAQHLYRAKIDADASFADDIQASGTPHFFINGRRLIGAQPLEKFTTLIDEELRRAETALAAGVAPAALYDSLIADGKGPPEPEVRVVAAPASAPSKGGAGARVVVQEFGDFQCPFCKRAEDTLRDLLAKNGASVRFVWRNHPLPFHPDAALAAEAAMEAYAQKGSAGFWRFHDMLFINQAGAGKPGLLRTDLDGYAKLLGLDMARWNAALDGRVHKAAVEADSQAATDAGINGTPSFTIGGYYLVGAQPAAKFQRLIDRVLRDGPAHAPAAQPLAH